MSEIKVLSEREVEIIQLVATGLTNREIAEKLTISPNTVKVHLRNIFDKIGVSSRTEATLYGIEHDIVHIPGVNGESSGDESSLTFQKIPWAIFTLSLAIIVIVIIFTSNLQSPQQVTAPAVIADFDSRWQELAPLPQPRSNMASLAYDGNIYVIAGESPDGADGSVFQYLSQEDRWDELSEKPTPVSEIEGVLIGEKIYVPGGKLADGSVTDTLEVYDPRNDIWEQKSSLPYKVSGYALVDFEGFLYLFGGWDGEKVLDIVLRYDPLNDKWEEKPSMSSARAYLGAAESGGKIYVIGGWDGKKAVAINEIFNPNRDYEGEESWISTIPISIPQYGLKAIQVLEIIYVSGGLDNEGNPTNLFLLNTNIDEWVEINKPEEYRNYSYSSLCHLGDSLYLLGGKLGEQITDRNYKFRVVYNLMIPISEYQ